MTGILPDLERELATLKDFQRRTVDYVFRRLYRDEPPAHRFLIADEVGLGKTLVARGIIARALHHLYREEIDRIDVVYVCSNQDIAQQNLNRLNVSEREEIALPTRLTLLPTQIEDLESRRVNFVSLTPGTSLETTKSRQGRKEERVLLFQVLADQPEISRSGLRNLLQATVHRENWERYLDQDLECDDTLAGDFLEALRDDTELWDRLVETAREFRWRTDRKRIPEELNRRRYAVIGDIRGLMAAVCVEALEPDLIILDEFQRFRDLLDGDTEAARLTRRLLDYQEAGGYRARVLLLSATPYRMLSMYDDEEDHYEDFLRTCRFLFDDSEDRVCALEVDLRRYRRFLYRVRHGQTGEEAGDVLADARSAVEERLRSVMVRTERAAGTGSRDAMMEDRQIYGEVQPSDLDQARTVDRVARAVEAYDPIEYWKSAPYLLNLMRGYQLTDRVAEHRHAPPPDLMAAVREGQSHLLRQEAFERYRKLDPGNGRLRALLGQTLDAGQWKLLWMPPSLPYLRPEGPYADADQTTKGLVFSSWRVVPEAIAALGSYAAERRMLADDTGTSSYQGLYEGATRPLEFTINDGRPSGMNPLMLLYPSPTLAELGDPLRWALANGGTPADRETVVRRVRDRIERRLQEADVDLDREGGALPDQRWYRVALARLDAARHEGMQGWVRRKGGWRSAGIDGFGAGFGEHVEQFAAGFDRERRLGRPPEDLTRVLAELALASPAVCAYRALRRVSGTGDATARPLLNGAVRVADGFRTLFNLPETVGFLRSQGGDLRYWERALRYGLQGNLQAVLDEYAHVLRESLGLMDAGPSRVVSEVSDAMAEALSLGSGRVHVDEVRPDSGENRINIETFRVRSRFALRFGHLQDERGETVARRGGVRQAFNSPFRPFLLATTSIGQEGLDFHTYCHAVYHWNLPNNPVDLEQREGRVHRYKGHAIRKNVAGRFGLEGVRAARDGSWPDPWQDLFQRALDQRPAGANDLVPFWVFEEGPARVERRVPLLPLSRETSQLERLKSSLAVYRMVFGQPRQEDLMAYLRDSDGMEGAGRLGRYRISLAPPDAELEQEPVPESAMSAHTSDEADAGASHVGVVPSSSEEMMELLFEDIQSFAPRYEPRSHGYYVGFEVEGAPDNFAYLIYRKYGVRIDAKVREDEPAVERLREAGGEVLPYREYTSGPGTYPIKVTFRDFPRYRDLLVEVLRAAYQTSARRRPS